MFKIICVTSRSLCRGDFLTQIESIAAARPDSIILREKDMNVLDYAALACTVMDICGKFGVSCTLHSFVREASELGAKNLHLPLSVLRVLTDTEKDRFKVIGASCHSVSDAIEAEQIGASYITAGHVFNTDCKKGLPGRGLDFLREVCRNTSLPVYAIGGISTDNIADIAAAGASGACIMSGFMRCTDPTGYIKKLRGELENAQ